LSKIKIGQICRHIVHSIDSRCIYENARRKEKTRFFDFPTSRPIEEAMSTLLDIYHALDASSLQRPYSGRRWNDLKLSTLFRGDAHEDQAYRLRIHEQLFGSRFSLDHDSSSKIAVSGSYRYIDERSKLPKCLALLPACNGTKIRQLHQRFIKVFPHIQAEWIFWSACGFSLLMNSRVPHATLRRFSETQNDTPDRIPALKVVRHVIRFSTKLAERGIYELHAPHDTSLRIAEPTVATTENQGLIATFFYEISDSYGRKMAFETSVLQ
jgi:hypothetical protein